MQHGVRTERPGHALVACALDNTQKKVCSACGYPSARNRRYNWCKKMIRRKNRGTGRMQYEKDLPRKFKNGFREQVTTASATV